VTGTIPDLDRHVTERLAALASPDASFCVGLSGGLDSVVLLDVLARSPRRRALAAVHVHHGLSPNADAWSEFCRERCAERGVALSVERVRIERAAPEGLEAAARAARYAVYAARSEDFVVLAHHLDDQSETVLLQVLRGTGLKGLAAMPEVRALAHSPVRILRPLLPIPRAALHAYAKERGLAWIEDESNASLRHDRNFLRHEIAPKLDARQPRWREAAARLARHAAGTEALLEELARIDGLPPEAGEDLPADPRLSTDRRANLLRAFLALNGAPMPAEARLAEMGRQLFGARMGARVRLEHEGLVLVKFRDRVRLERVAPVCEPLHHPWNGELDVALGATRGAVRFECSKGAGIALAKTRGGDWHFAGRTGGERLRVDPKRPTRTLKNLFQEHEIPPWDRERMPLLFHADTLVWVPGIGIEAQYACAPEEPGLRPSWLPDARKT